MSLFKFGRLKAEGLSLSLLIIYKKQRVRQSQKVGGLKNFFRIYLVTLMKRMDFILLGKCFLGCREISSMCAEKGSSDYFFNGFTILVVRSNLQIKNLEKTGENLQLGLYAFQVRDCTIQNPRINITNL